MAPAYRDLRLGLALVALLISALFAARVHSQPLAVAELELTGFSVHLTQSALTIPRDVPASIGIITTGTLPLSNEATIRARLSGPSFQAPLEIESGISDFLAIPPMTRGGIHFLDEIRVEGLGVEPIPATPSSVTINVLDELLVTEIESRPLTLEEIEALGIQVDDTSFQAFNFTVALTTESEVVEIDLPVLAPVSGGGAEEPPEIYRGGPTQLPGAPELPNVSLAPVMLEPLQEIQGQLPPDVEIPPIPGIVVIPGNVAFLNQFFSVLLLVSNEAPDGTPLIVRDLEAEILLPPGRDNVVGDIRLAPPFDPEDPEFDNPLRIAATAAGRENEKPVLSPGLDGLVGTGDDVDVLEPQGQGQAEFLVEGVREGSHLVDLEIRGTLEGLPGGPIPVVGTAQGAVVVRDPSFSLTFLHPDAVGAGQLYDLQVHIQNTSQVDANLVTVCLEPRNLTGARFVDEDDSCQTFDTIGAGNSAAAIFELEALRSGRVTASNVDVEGEAGVVSGRRLSLVAGVTESGVPLSPDTLILPSIISVLRERAANDDLLSRALALLGEANSIATAPRGSLPVGVEPIAGNIVVQRARELTEAALRLDLSVQPGPGGAPEPIPEGLLLTLQDLYFDFLGAGLADTGWDTLYRSSRQARLFGAALTEVLAGELVTLALSDLAALQASWADTESYREDHVSLVLEGVGGDLPVVLTLTDFDERVLGGSLDPLGGLREIPKADVLTFDTTGQVAMVSNASSFRYVGSLVALEDGAFDLGVVAPGIDGQLRQLLFRSLDVSAGEELLVTIRPRAEPAVVLTRADGSDIAPDDNVLIPDGPPEVLSVVQLADFETDEFGRVVGVLFDEEVTVDSSQRIDGYSISEAAIAMVESPDLVDANEVTSARLQFGDRLLLVGLRDPVGPFVSRQLDVSGVQDLRGQTMVPVVGAPILEDPDRREGAHVTGRVTRASGDPVAGAEITYYQAVVTEFGIRQERALLRKRADDQGAFNLDFVADIPRESFRIDAADVATGERGSLRTSVRNDGERLSLDIVLIGRGSVEGTVRDAAGQPVTGAVVSITSSANLARRDVHTDQNGSYRIDGVPVGPFGIDAVSTQGKAKASGVIEGDGSVAMLDLTIFVPDEGTIRGQVRFPDGSPAEGIEAFLLTTNGGFLDGRVTDEMGSFVFPDVNAGTYKVRGIDVGAALVGEALISVTQGQEAFVVVTLEGSGSVSGRVYEANGATPVSGALVAGGVQVVTADQNGDYFLPVVPVGTNEVEAVSPTSGAAGSRDVTILNNGQAIAGADIVLEALGAISGRVLSPVGDPVPDQEVRILIEKVPGYLGQPPVFLVRTTTTDALGDYRFDNLELRGYTLMAVRANEVANGFGQPSQASPTDVVDLQFVEGNGELSGQVLLDGEPEAAQVTLRATAPNAAGILESTVVGTVVSDPGVGFRFTGLFPGAYSLTADSFFADASTSAAGQIPESDPVVDGLVLQITANTATLSGTVLAPDGMPITPILGQGGSPLPLSVCISSGALSSVIDDVTPVPCPGSSFNCDGLCVDASDGTYESTIALPAGGYTVEVDDQREGSPYLGLRGRASISLSRGQAGERDVRMLGLGDLRVDVFDGSNDPIPGTIVTVRRTTFPSETQQLLLTGTSAIFAGLSEGPVAVTAVVSTDPGVDVGGRETLRGFAGHATGVIVRDAEVPVSVTIRSAGVVTGTFFGPDGETSVTNSQVQLRASGQPSAFTVTDESGAFRFDGVPVGGFTLEGFDASTARSGSTSARVDFDEQLVVANIQLGPLGSVEGVALSSDGTTPIGGGQVDLLRGSAVRQTVTSNADGTFEFQGVAGGSFTVRVISLDGLSGQAQGRIDFEGQVAGVTVELEGSGRIEGLVSDADDGLVANAQVTLTDPGGQVRFAQTGDSGAELGRYAFDQVPLGDFSIRARPSGAVTPGDGGTASGRLAFDRAVAIADVDFTGTISVDVDVQGAVPGTSIEVRLNSIGIFGGSLSVTEPGGGITTFVGVPRTRFNASVTQTTVSGSVISASDTIEAGELPPAGATITVPLVLEEVATVPGLVEHPDGLDVTGARVTLSTGSLSTALLVDSSGTFEFLGIPLDVPLEIVAEGSGRDRAVFRGRVDDQGEIRDADDVPIDPVILELDVHSPTVLAISPDDGEAAVSTSQVITVLFSEPLDPVSVTTCTGAPASEIPGFRLLESLPQTPDPGNADDPCDDGDVVPASVTLSPDGQLVTLDPGALLDTTFYTLVIDAGRLVPGDVVGGVRDQAGRPLDEAVVSTFTTRDEHGPVVTEVSPSDGAIEVDVGSVVRITFGEPIDAASLTGITLSGPAGAVPSQIDGILGNTVVVVTPTDGGTMRQDLERNATYTLTVAGVTDPSGNPIPAPFVSTFQTPDTVAPSIAGITSTPSAARSGELLLISADAPDLDVARVEFILNGVPVAVVSSRAPNGRFESFVVMPQGPAAIAARATDAVGNTGDLGGEIVVTLVADDPPTLAILSPVPPAQASPGETLHVTVQVNDDVGVASVTGALSGVATFSQTLTVTPPSTGTTRDFEIPIPSELVSGNATFAAFATDTKGQVSATVTREIQVVDDTLPTVSVDAPATGDLLLPGTTVQVFVTASDAGGVTDLTLEVPEVGFSETLAVSPPEQSVPRFFSVPLPDPFPESTVSFTVRATDRSGNVGETTSQLPVFGAFVIQSVAAAGVEHDTNEASANVGQTVTIVGEGLVESLVARFPGTDQAGAPLNPTAPLFNVTSTEASVVVPGTASTGVVQLETVQGDLLSGSDFLQIVPTVSGLNIPAGDDFAAGVAVTITGTGFREGFTDVDFPPAALIPVAADDVLAANATLLVTLPDGVEAGQAFVTTDGGVSNPLPILVFGLLAEAEQGSALDPMVASANVDQMITVTGEGLSTSLLGVFASTDAAGNDTLVEAFLENPNVDGTQAQVRVPTTAVTGPVQLRADGEAEPFPATTFLQVVPTLATLTVPEGQILEPGVVASIEGSGFRIGSTVVIFPGADSVSPDSQTDSALSVTVPAGLTSGEVRVATDGGQSAPLLLPGTFGITAAADHGTPANATEPAANVGQTVAVTGTALSEDLLLVLPAVDDEGAAAIVEAALSGVSPDATSASAVIPEGATTGTVFLRHRDGVPVSSTVMLQIVPDLLSASIPVGAEVAPGVVATLAGSGFVESATTVEFAGAAPVPADDVFLSGQRLTVGLPSGVTTGSVTVTTAGGTSRATELAAPFINGSFETGTIDPGSFTTMPLGSTFIDGWTVTDADVDWVGSFWIASDGARSLDLGGVEDGAISQAFATAPGKAYEVLFDLAGNPACAPTVKTLEVTAAADSATYTFDITGRSTSAMGWEGRRLAFTATGPVTTLTFASLSAGSGCGPALDNVRLFVNEIGLDCGADPVLTSPGGYVRLLVSPSDPGLGSLIYQWTQFSPTSPVGVFVGGDQANASWVAPDATHRETFTLSAVVSGESGGAGICEVDVTVDPQLSPQPLAIDPIPYLRAVDSPFLVANGGIFTLEEPDFFLEDFEDGVLNTTGVTSSAGTVVGPSGFRDSVDGDDGVIDGSGTAGYAFYSGGTGQSLTFTFDEVALGGLPTHAGIVWTDVGAAAPTSGFDQVSLEAFDAIGASLGVIGPEPVGDGQLNGETAEDRFFGLEYADGISAITISSLGSTDWEVDHLQYGTFDPDADLDSDGLNDLEEREAGTRIDRADTDEDGFLDKDELDFGSDPLDDSSIPSVVTEIVLSEASGRSVSVLNTADPTLLPDVEVNVELTEASGPTVSVLNAVDPTLDLLPEDITLGTATGPVVIIENQASH